MEEFATLISEWADILAMLAVIVTLLFSSGKVGKRMGELMTKLEDHIKHTSRINDELVNDMKALNAALGHMDSRVDKQAVSVARLEGYIEAINKINGNNNKEKTP